MPDTPAAPAAVVDTPPAAAAPTATPPPATSLVGGDPAAKPAEAPASKPAEAAKPAEGVPEKYEFKFGEGVVVDNVALEAFSPVLRELGLPQDKAQKLVDIYAAQTQRQASDFAKQLGDPAFALTQASSMLASHAPKWADAVKSDKEIGGQAFEANVQTMQRAMARFGTPELKTLLNQTGLGNHPELARLFFKVGTLIREDSPQYGGGGSGARKTNAEVFYGGKSATGA